MKITQTTNRTLISATICFAAMLFYTGCATVKKETRISSPIRATQYNSVASQYLERPTFVKVTELGDGREVLWVEMEQYAYGIGSSAENINRYNVAFRKDSITQYINLIDKFLEWEAKAVERGDQFTKEIGRAPAWTESMGAEQKFEFHSGNSKNHYLAIVFCTSVTCLEDQAILFSKEHVLILKKLLLDFGDGRIQQTDINSIYN